MTTQAKPQVWMRWWNLLLRMVWFTGGIGVGALLFCAWFLLVAILVTPLAKVVWDYWTPYVEQAMRGKAAAVPQAVKAKAK